MCILNGDSLLLLLKFCYGGNILRRCLPGISMETCNKKLIENNIYLFLY